VKKPLLSALVTLSLSAILIASPVVEYVFTIIDDPEFDLQSPDSTAALGINNAGDIVGTFGLRAFLYGGGAFTPLMYPGSEITSALGINDRGDIVGQFTDGSGTHGFVYTDGTFTPFDVPGAIVNGRTATHAHGINAKGEIVGDFDMSVGTGARTEGFLYSAGSFTLINFPGADSTSAFGINDIGDIVGSTSFPGVGGASGYILSGGRFTKLDHPDASSSGGSLLTGAFGVNSAGKVVGIFTDAGAYRGFIYDRGTFAPLGAPPNVDPPIVPLGINDAGQIVGYFGRHGFLATPARGPFAQ
jgi:probable HAF family extracellular repeat protein